VLFPQQPLPIALEAGGCGVLVLAALVEELSSLVLEVGVLGGEEGGLGGGEVHRAVVELAATVAVLQLSLVALQQALSVGRVVVDLLLQTLGKVLPRLPPFVDLWEGALALLLRPGWPAVEGLADGAGVGLLDEQLRVTGLLLAGCDLLPLATRLLRIFLNNHAVLLRPPDFLAAGCILGGLLPTNAIRIIIGFFLGLPEHMGSAGAAGRVGFLRGFEDGCDVLGWRVVLLLLAELGLIQWSVGSILQVFACAAALLLGDALQEVLPAGCEGVRGLPLIRVFLSF
jgi:hypothetical protein